MLDFDMKYILLGSVIQQVVAGAHLCNIFI